MCTAIVYLSGHRYFGRTLDYEHTFGQQIVITPRQYPLEFRHADPLPTHYAMIGMALEKNGYPLYFDAMNECGLGMAGLHFPGNAWYASVANKNHRAIASFEIIPFILGSCRTVQEAAAALRDITIVDTAFSRQLPPSPLHWIISDGEKSIVAESMKDGLHVYDDPIGVLTNEPPFEYHLYNFSNYLHLSHLPQQTNITKNYDNSPYTSYSRGMGAIGLPGDHSSSSRFVRAAFNTLNAMKGATVEEDIMQYFHITESVSQLKGSVTLADGSNVYTVYTSCCDLDAGRYYYITYDRREIKSEDMSGRLDGTQLIIKKE